MVASPTTAYGLELIAAGCHDAGYRGGAGRRSQRQVNRLRTCRLSDTAGASNPSANRDRRHGWRSVMLSVAPQRSSVFHRRSTGDPRNHGLAVRQGQRQRGRAVHGAGSLQSHDHSEHGASPPLDANFLPGDLAIDRSPGAADRSQPTPARMEATGPSIPKTAASLGRFHVELGEALCV